MTATSEPPRTANRHHARLRRARASWSSTRSPTRSTSRWWGPNGFTTTTHAMDVRPGGVWRFVMHGPDGRDYQNRIIYLEVARPDCLVYKHARRRGRPEDVNFHTTVTFDERGGKTERDDADGVPDGGRPRRAWSRSTAPCEGGQQTLARLGEYLAGTIGPDRSSARASSTRPATACSRRSATRTNWKQWWGPNGFTNTFHEFDLRPGGAWRFIMHGPDGTDYPNESVFVEVVSRSGSSSSTSNRPQVPDDADLRRGGRQDAAHVAHGVRVGRGVRQGERRSWPERTNRTSTGSPNTSRRGDHLRRHGERSHFRQTSVSTHGERTDVNRDTTHNRNTTHMPAKSRSGRGAVLSGLVGGFLLLDAGSPSCSSRSWSWRARVETWLSRRA